MQTKKHWRRPCADSTRRGIDLAWIGETARMGYDKWSGWWWWWGRGGRQKPGRKISAGHRNSGWYSACAVYFGFLSWFLCAMPPLLSDYV